MPSAGRDVDGDAAAVVDDAHAAVGEQRDVDAVGVAGEGLVDRVVDDLPHQVVQAALTGRADVHAGTLADRLEALEDRDRAGVVGGGRELGGQLGDGVGAGDRLGAVRGGRVGGGDLGVFSVSGPTSDTVLLGTSGTGRTHRPEEDTGSGRAPDSAPAGAPSWFHVERAPRPAPGRAAESPSVYLARPSSDTLR